MKGRPTKLTPTVQKTIIETVRVGATFEAACGRAGVPMSTFMEWRQRGAGESKRKKTKLYADFAEAVDRAVADAEIHLVATINKASSKNWQAAAWLLKNRHPDRYSDRTDLRHSGEISQPAKEPDREGYTREELEELDRIEDARAERLAKEKKD